MLSLVRARLKRIVGRRGVALFRRGRVLTRRARLRVGQGGRKPHAGLVPASREWGLDRGTAIDRHYIEDFLGRYGRQGDLDGDIRGKVLEIGGGEYCERFGRRSDAGRPGGVESLDILDIEPSNPAATIVGDLTDGDTLRPDTYDCVICTEVLMLIYDVRTALANLHRAMRPGGVLLVTVGGVQQICTPEIDRHGDYWRFTSLSMRRLLEEVFPSDQVTVEAFGNVLSASAYLYGLAAEELSRGDLDLRDSQYEVTIAARAVKASGD